MHYSSTMRRYVCLIAAVLLAFAGCGRSPTADRPPLYPAQGKVLFNGQPAAGLRVSLHRVDKQAGPMPTAVTGADGAFQLGTYAPGDGAPEGDYLVTATWLKSSNPDGDAPEIDRLRGRYVDPLRSAIKVHLDPAANQLAPFELR